MKAVTVIGAKSFCTSNGRLLYRFGLAANVLLVAISSV